MIKRKKGFTLIELIAVLVIMAILALIVTPLVMSIIRKARVSADKRSIDAYGRSIELAIAGYLLDNGTFPTSIEQLTIEYSGEEVICSTTQLNSDSSVYLADCTVGGRSVDGYTYGSDKSPTYTAYTVGDEVTYNNVNYYVIKDSGAKEDTVTLLKAEPLTVAEVNTYGVGHVNRYSFSSAGAAYNQNGYGGMAYYESEECGYPNASNGNYTYKSTGCTTDYAQSEIKYVVDSWALTQAPAASEARLIQYDELISNFDYEYHENATAVWYTKGVNTPSWVYNSNYDYWTMTEYNESSYVGVWFVRSNGSVDGISPDGNGVVRPVITISKSAL